MEHDQGTKINLAALVLPPIVTFRNVIRAFCIRSTLLAFGTRVVMFARAVLGRWSGSTCRKNYGRSSKPWRSRTRAGIKRGRGPSRGGSKWWVLIAAVCAPFCRPFFFRVRASAEVNLTVCDDVRRRMLMLVLAKSSFCPKYMCRWI